MRGINRCDSTTEVTPEWSSVKPSHSNAQTEDENHAYPFDGR